MTRLTMHTQDGFGYAEYQWGPHVDEQDVLLRFGRLEDILYAPDGTEIITLDRLRELAQADKDGRCVVLPCKVGDTVYLLDDGYGNPVEAEVDYWMTGENGLVGSVVFGTGQRMKFIGRRIGKTVFLTRTEADAALAGEGRK